MRLTLLGLCSLAMPGCSVLLSPKDVSIGFTVGVGLFLLANVLYVKMRLEDEPSAFRRMSAFLVGLPTTFLSFLLIEPQDSWIQRRFNRGTTFDPDADPAEVHRDFEREFERVRRAQELDHEAGLDQEHGAE